MSCRWKKKNAPQVGQVWRHNAYRLGNRPVYLVLDEARMGWGWWVLDLLDLERATVHRIDVKREHETWEQIA